MNCHSLKSLVSALAGSPACGALLVLGAAASAPAQIIIGPRIVQPYVVHPQVIVRPPVIIAPPPVIVRPPIVVAPPVVVVPPTVVAAPQAEVAPSQAVDANDLHPLVAPIALYPDPLLSVVLPAATYPQQVARAAQFAAANPAAPETLINAQPWEPSIKALVHYPAVLQQMSADPRWTESLGSAFSADPVGVSKAVQDLRGRAIAVGSLVASPQIAIVQEGGVIAIQPAVETALFVPVYNPLTVYTEPAVLTYSPEYITGPWLVNGYDWSSGAVFVGDWHGPYVVENHVWVRNRYFRVDHYHYWQHDVRHGPAPRIARDRWTHPQSLRGHESHFRSQIAKAPAGAGRQPDAMNRSNPASTAVHTSGQVAGKSRSQPASQGPSRDQTSGSAAPTGHAGHSSGGGGGGRRK